MFDKKNRVISSVVLLLAMVGGLACAHSLPIASLSVHAASVADAEEGTTPTEPTEPTEPTPTVQEQLTKKIASAKRCYQSYYTTESWTKFKEVLDTMPETGADKTEEEAKKLLDELSKAMEALVFVSGDTPRIYVSTDENKGNSMSKADGWATAKLAVVYQSQNNSGNSGENGSGSDSENGSGSSGESGSENNGAKNAAVTTIYDEAGSIKVRGNSTALASKKPYNIKFTTEQNIMGMGSQKKWMLLANAYDATMLRNFIAFDFAEKLGIKYSSKQEFAELYVDGEYKGAYQILQKTEQVPINKEEGKTDEFLIEGEAHRNDTGVTYLTTTNGLRFAMNDPEIPTEDQKTKILEVLNKIDAAISSGKYSEVQALVDTESFARLYVLEETLKNYDRSGSYFYYYKDGKLHAGPPWDFDLSSGNVNVTYSNYHNENGKVEEGLWQSSADYFPHLLKYQKFADEVDKIFQQQKSYIQSLFTDNTGVVDTAVTKYKTLFDNNYKSKDENGAGWNRSEYYDYRRVPEDTYEGDITYLKKFLKERYTWLEQNWASKLSELIQYKDDAATDISGFTLTVAEGAQTYDGNAKTPEVTVKNGDATLTKGTDYTVAYANNTNAGTATITVTGRGSYAGTLTTTFTIEKANQTLTVSSETVEVKAHETATLTVTGAQGKVTYKVTDPAIASVSEQGVVTGLKAGTTTVTIAAAGDDNYNAAEKTVNVTVTENTIQISGCTITLSPLSYVYDGLQKSPTVTVQNGSITLVKDTDYTVSYTNNVNAGTGKVIITGKGHYTGSVEKEFTISKAQQNFSVILSASALKVGETANITLRGSAGAVTYQVNDGSNVISIDNSGVITAKAVGTATVTITAAGDANHESGTKTVTVTVTQTLLPITNFEVTLSQTSYTYDGTAKQPGVTVKNGDTTLSANSDYTVAYENNTNAGTATVRITGAGNYTGELTRTFTIAKAEQTLTVNPTTIALKVGERAQITVSGAQGVVSYNVQDGNVASMEGNAVTALQAGSTTITVTAAATDNYNAATATVALTVTQPAPTVVLENGYYSIENNGHAIDMLDVRYDDETPAVSYFFSDQNNQVFHFEQQSDGNYKITVVHSKKSLTMTQTGTVVQRHDTADDSQRWSITKQENGTYLLYNVGQKRYLSLTQSGVSGVSGQASVTLNVREAVQPIVHIVAVEDGIYEMQSVANSNVIAPQNGSVAEGATIALQQKNSKNIQKWRVENQKDGKVYITSVGSQMMLDLDVPSGQVHQYTDGYNLNQRWYLEVVADGAVFVQNAATGTVLTANGTSLGVAGKNESDQNQKWQLTYTTAAEETNGLADGYYTIGNQGWVIDIKDAKYDEGLPALSWYFGKQNNQLFKFEKQSGDYYKITAVHAQKALTMQNDGSVTQNHWSDAANQRWTVTRDASGNTYIKNVGTGKLLSVTGAGVSGETTNRTAANTLQVIGYSDVFAISHIVTVDDGIYEMQLAGSGNVIAPQNGSVAEGATIALQQKNSKNIQKWRVENQKDGKVYITSVGSQMMLDLDVPSGQVHQYTDGYNLNQRWYLEVAADGAVFIQNAATGTVLTANGTSLGVAGKNESNQNQKWQLTYTTAAEETNGLADGYYTIGNQGWVIDIKDAKYDEGLPALSWYFGKQNNQLFKFEKQSGDYYKITAVHAQKALTMQNDGSVTQNHWSDAANQRWTVTRDASGNTYIKNVGTGKLLSVTGAGVSGETTNRTAANTLQVIGYSDVFAISHIVAVEDGVYKLQSSATQKYVGVTGLAEGTSVAQQDASSDNTQLWRVENQKDGRVYITNAATGFMLDLDVASKTINQWSDGWNMNQRWWIEAAGANYRIKNALTNEYLAAQGTDGLTAAANSAENTQIWSLVYQS